MKKLFSLSLAVATFMTVSAADFTVYNDGNLTGGIATYGWWAAGMDFTAENPAGGDAKVFSFRADNGGAAASMGLYATGNDGAVTGPLHSANLCFSWYATTTANVHIRLTADNGNEQDYVLDVNEDNIKKWNEVNIPVATTFPVVAQQWDEFKGKGAGYVFGITLDDAVAETVVYFDNIRYTDIDEAWEAPAQVVIVPPTTVPGILQPADDILSIFSPDGRNNFGIGGWGQKTQVEFPTIDGVEVMRMTNFNYLGWELNPAVNVSDYKYMHVDFYPCETTAFGFTPISPGKERSWIAPEVKVNEWNSYDVLLSYFPIDYTNVFQIKFDQGEGIEGYVANVYFWKENGPEIPVEPGATFAGELSGSVEQIVLDSGELKNYPYDLKYEVVYNEDKTLTVTADYTFTDGEPFGLVPGTVYVDNAPFDMTMEGLSRKVTTTATYDPHQMIEIRFYIPGGAGVILQDKFSYTVGSESETTGTSVAEVATVDEAPAYYTLQGVKVADPDKGIYIKVTAGKAVKVIL